MIDKVTSSNTFERAERQTKPVRRFIEKIINDWSFDFASMLAYSLLIALLPIAVTIFGIVGFILTDYPQYQKELKDKIIQLFPSDNTTQSGIQQVVDLAFDQLSKDAGSIFAIGFIFSMIGSSRLFIAIDKCMTIIYRLPERTFLRQYLMALGTLFIFIIVIILMLTASSVPSALMNMIPGGGGRFGVFLVGILVSLSISFGLFQIIYRLIPNKKMIFKKTWCGTLAAAITLEIFIILFPLYVRQFMGNYAGQIGFAVILIFFFYYFSIILIFGAQINAYFFEEYPPLDHALGTYISQMHEQHRHNDDEQQQHRVGWINKLWPWKKRRSVEPQSQDINNV